MKPKVRFRFTLRTFLLLTAVCAAACLVVVPGMFEQARMRGFSGAGVQIFTEPRGQYLLRQFAGDRLSQRVVYVHLDDPSIDDSWLKRLRQFRYIEVLSVKSAKVTDEGLRYLEDLPCLMSLDLVDTSTSPEGVQKLRRASKSLKRLEVTTTEP